VSTKKTVTKKPGGKGKRRTVKVPPPVLVFRDPDGTQSMPFTHQEMALSWLQGAAVKSLDDDAALRKEGLKRLNQAAKILADYQERLWNNSSASKLDRPKAKSGIRERIISMMKPEHRQGVEFKVFLDRWEHEPIDELILVQVEPLPPPKTSFRVIDDRADGAVEQTYLYSTLEKMYRSS
jgi:hypothetical protein